MPTKLVRPVDRFRTVDGKTVADLRVADADPLAPFVVRGNVVGKSALAVQLVKHSQDVRSSRGQSVVFLSFSKNDVPGLVRTPSEFIDARLQAVFGLLRSGSGSSRLFVVDGVDQGSESTWEQLNQRRLALIDKDIDHGLSAAEAAELADLEKKAQQYLDATAPVSFEIISRLQECAARDGFTVELD